jgi:hypothetical protein
LCGLELLQKEGEQKKMKGQERQTIVVDIYFTRGVVILLILALLTAGFVTYLAWGQGGAIAAGSQTSLTASTNMRRYYMTPGFFDGANALTACDSGYHMASLWEILDPSNLKYDTDRGYVIDDSGQGPPADPGAWIRTGSSGLSSTSPGYANCLAWTRGDSGEYGSTAWLGGPWTAGRDIHVWDTSGMPCNTPLRVWCVEDRVSTDIYLPLVLRSYVTH